ncbi:hypothetical protein DNK47_00415 [Mycoplasma wenyonii]|uniref:Uncharacterized protein n=1 Tax=Mycoplasma wenyonii TaxID=65123 RepID=A0A328PU64_9MOLU|nr:hypothetical protein [Mycoplasma wenyonii]RAO95310.1 hypothetical protein DNK47_00415 [Mycoplasma wenyonii]
MIVFLNENGKTPALVLIGLGAFILSLISFTQYKGVKDTKNTVFLDKKFMIGQLFACFFLGFACIWGMCDWSDVSYGCIDAVLTAINLILFYVNFYTLRVKLANIDAAKKAGMTEAEHYDKVIAPSLKLQTNS